MGYRIRPVEPADEAEWVRLRHALFGDELCVHAEEVRSFLTGTAPEPQAVLVAVDAGRMLGHVELSIRPCAEGCATTNVAYLEGWYVRPEARRRGVGRALVHAAEQWARNQGCTEFASDTALDNRAGALAHQACGFEEIGRVRCFRKLLVSETAADR